MNVKTKHLFLSLHGVGVDLIDQADEALLFK